MTSPIRPTDNEARGTAKSLLLAARYASLGVIDPASRAPMVTRAAVTWIDKAPHILISDLSLHTKALAQNSACSLLIGEPEAKGDPLTHPRITLQCSAQPASKTHLRGAWINMHPKAKLYIDFTDFQMMRLDVIGAHLNGGFGKAFTLTPADLA